MNNGLSTLFDKGLLSDPGDKLFAYVTKTGRQVIKIEKSNGVKASATRYPTTKKVVQTLSMNSSK